MRLALISDIHGNLAALEAVLADLALAQPERVVCLGDVALDGPQPHETVTRLRTLGYPTIMGNTDDKLIQRAARLTGKVTKAPKRQTVEQAPSTHDDGEPAPPAELDDHQREKDVKNWTARQLTPDDLAYLASFVPTLEVALGSEQTLLCCHGSPLSYHDRVQATTPDATLAPWFAEAEARGVTLVAGGHTHIQLLRRYRQMTLLNPGSVGLPIAEDTSGVFRVLPWAEYALITIEETAAEAMISRTAATDATASGTGAANNSTDEQSSAAHRHPQGALRIELRRVPYDTRMVVAAYLASGMPHAEWMAADWR